MSRPLGRLALSIVRAQRFLHHEQMARTAEEKRANARKYGRRRALLEAAGNAEQQTALARRLLIELKAAGAAGAKLGEFESALRQSTGITRRRAAIWAICDALEAQESERPRRVR